MQAMWRVFPIAEFSHSHGFNCFPLCPCEENDSLQHWTKCCVWADETKGDKVPAPAKLMEGLHGLEAAGVKDEREGLGCLTFRDGGHKVDDPEMFGFDADQGDLFIDGSCYSGNGRLVATGLAVVQMVINAQGENIKWRVLQESIGQGEPQDAAYAEQKALLRANLLS